MSQIGKISSLPRAIRDQLNRRIYDGDCGRHLLDWLNSLPEVLKIIHRDFAAREINDQNLSDWKQGGYRQWLIHQEALTRVADLAENARELEAANSGRISDHLATILLARYAAELAECNGNDDEPSRRKLRALHDLCRNIVDLRRTDIEAARIAIEQSRDDRVREKTEEELAEYFRQWIEYPKVMECIADTSDPETRARRIREILTLQPPPSTSPIPAEQ